MPPVALSSSPPLYTTSTGVQSALADKNDTSYRGYDHVHWWVGNAKQAAAFYSSLFNFKQIAYKGLETGSRIIASHVISNGQITFVLSSPLRAPEAADISEEDRELLQEMYEHLATHGDAVKDVAFEVDDVKAVYELAVQNGARSIASPQKLKDADGEMWTATVSTYGDTTHTLVQRRGYRGVFMPGYRAAQKKTYIQGPEVRLEAIDHCVGNQDWGKMDEACD
jgi:4-hydroxyphenylpyruvate dioxygenase